MSGYKPFVGAGTPDVVWSEGTIEAALALDRLDIDSAWSSAAVASIAATATGSVAGPDGFRPCGGEHRIVDAAVGPGRRSADHLGDTGNPSR